MSLAQTSLAFDDGDADKLGIRWRRGSIADANALLAAHHYLGPISGGRLVHIGYREGTPVACQVWRRPTARRLPNDGSWLELSRWCLTPEAGANAGTRQHAAAVRLIKAEMPEATLLVSYSDPSAGHTGALYRACNWRWAPVWHRLRPPPTGQGEWTAGKPQAVKDRWVFPIRPLATDEERLRVNDPAAVRYWLSNPTEAELRWASSSPAPDLREAARAALEEGAR